MPALTPWPTTEAAGCSTALPIPTPAPQPNAELIAALKRAYPEGLPSEVQDLIEKNTESTSKQLTKDLHSATTSLGRARKALREAQSAESAHRQAWLRHLKEATKQWEEQLDLYRRKQSQFQEAKLRAGQEVEAARKLIQSLNSATAPKESVTAPVEEVEEVKTGVAEAQEEEELKRSLQSTLTACAQAAGLEIQTEEITIHSDEEIELTKSNLETTRKRPKAEQDAGGRAGSSWL